MEENGMTAKKIVAQNDHDKLIEVSVMLQTIMQGQTRLEQQIKDLIQGQSAALAGWEAESKAIHDAQDLRLRKLEDLATQYIPTIQQYETRITTIEATLESLQGKQIFIAGGWKATTFIIGAIITVIGAVFEIVRIFSCTSHIC